MYRHCCVIYFCDVHCAFVGYSVIQKDGLNFVRLYFLNYIRYANDYVTFERGRPKFSNTTAIALECAPSAHPCSSVI